jgi:hypothetical protein
MYWMWKGIQLYIQSEDNIEEQTGWLTPYYKDQWWFQYMDQMTQNLISGQAWTFGGNLERDMVEKAKESTEK